MAGYEPGVCLTYPLMVGTAKQCDMERLEASLQFEDSRFVGNIQWLRNAVWWNRLYVITNADGAVLACTIPELCYYDKKAIYRLQDWSPLIMWVHPVARRAHLGKAMFRVLELLAIADGQSSLIIDVLIGSEPFWESLGFVSDDDMACNVRQILGIDRQTLLGHKRKSISHLKPLCQVLLSEPDPESNCDELSDLVSAHQSILCEKRAVGKEAFVCSRLEVAAFLTLFVPHDDAALSVGIMEFATIEQNIMELKNTVCLPMPVGSGTDSGTDGIAMAVYILPTKNTDRSQLSSPTLVHFAYFAYFREDVERLNGAVFIRKFILLKQSGILYHGYHGATGIRPNTPLAPTLRGINFARWKSPRVLQLDTFLPRNIIHLVEEYTAQFLPPIHCPNQDKFEPWIAELQPL